MLEQLTTTQLGLVALGIYIGIRLLIEIERYARRKVFNDTSRDRRTNDNPGSAGTTLIIAKLESLETILCLKLENIKQAISNLKKDG